MRRLIAATALAALALTACGSDKADEPSQAVQEANRDACDAALRTLKTAAETHRALHDEWPTTIDALGDLTGGLDYPYDITGATNTGPTYELNSQGRDMGCPAP